MSSRQEAEDICDSALALSPAEREGFLADACGEDLDLRDEVRELLAVYESGNDFLESAPPPFELARGTLESGTPGGDGPAEESIGELGPYRLIRELGRGGQGTVYLAHDTRLDRKVALKVLPLFFASTAEGVARLEREARAASRLEHPGLATVYEAGESGGVHYLAMRYVEGRTLADHIATAREAEWNVPWLDSDAGPPAEKPSSSGSRRAQIDRILRFFESAARALHVAHEAGLVHRDIKPGNIMVSQDGTPVIVDFGLTRELETETAELTRSGDVLGTPHYMAPEQISEERTPVDRRCDVYSLGASLFEVLTLERPFQAATREGLFQSILQADVADPRSLNSQLTRDLSVVLQTALEKEPRRRYQSALDLAEDLRRVHELKPIRARPAGALLKARRWAQRNPMLATASIGLFVVLTASLIISLFYLGHLRDREIQLQRQGQLTSVIAASAKVRRLELENAEALLEEAPGERDWGWRYLHHQLERDTIEQYVGHDQPFWSVGFVSGTDLIFGVDQDSNVRLWDRSAGPGSPGWRVECPGPPDARIRKPLAVSVDGTRVLSMVRGSGDGQELRLWDLRTGTTVHQDPPDRDRGSALEHGYSAIVPGMTEFVRGGSDQWGNALQVDAWPNEPRFHQVRISRSGEWVAFIANVEGQDASGIRVRHRVEEETKLGPFRSGTRLQPTLALNRDASLVAGSTANRVLVWHVESGDRLDLATHGEVSFSPRGDLLAVAIPNAVEIWDPVTGEHLRTLHAVGRKHLDLDDASWNGTLLATRIARDGEYGVRVCDAATGSRPVLQGHSSHVYPVAITGDGRTVASGSWDRTVRLWDATTREEIAVLEGHSDYVVRVNFDPSGRFLVSASRAEVIEWNVETGESIHRFSPGSFYAGYRDGSLHISEAGATEGSKLVTIKAMQAQNVEPILAVSRDGVRMVTGAGPSGSGATIRYDTIAVRDARSRQILATFQAGKALVRAVSFSPDGKRLVTGDDSGKVLVWDAEGADETPLLQLDRHGGSVHDVVFVSPNRIASASADRTIRIWDAVYGDELIVLRGHEDYVWSLAVSDDGSRLVSGSGDGTVRIWEAPAIEEERTSTRR